MFEGDKNCKIGTKFIIRSTAQQSESTQRSCLFKTEAWQEIHTQREREWASSLMRRRAVSQKPGRNIHAERSVGVLNEKSSKEVIEITYVGQFFWVFLYLWVIILFLFSLLLQFQFPKGQEWVKSKIKCLIAQNKCISKRKSTGIKIDAILSICIWTI